MIGFFGIFNPEIPKRLDVMNIKSLSVFFGSFFTPLTDFISFACGGALPSPRASIISFISANPSGMIFAGKVFCTIFSITYIITKKMFLFSVSITNIFSYYWRTTISTWSATVSPFLIYIRPSDFKRANNGTRFSVMYSPCGKTFSTNRTLFFYKAAIQTILTCCAACKKLSTIFACFRFHANHYNTLRRFQLA
jgi:hypothetical protein